MVVAGLSELVRERVVQVPHFELEWRFDENVPGLQVVAVAGVELVVVQLVEEQSRRQTGSAAVVPTDFERFGHAVVEVEQLAELVTEID